MSKFSPPAARFPIENRDLGVPECQNFPPAAGFMLLLRGKTLIETRISHFKGQKPAAGGKFWHFETL